MMIQKQKEANDARELSKIKEREAEAANAEALEKQEHKEEPMPEASKARDRLFTEMEKADPEKITENISSLSLGVSLDEMIVLRRIFEKS